MEVYRVVLTSWTASFRCPNIIAGIQLSADAPPISTIYGLLSSASGKYITPDDCGISYCYRYAGSTFDLETIYKVVLNSKDKPSKNAIADIVKRQVLFDNVLILYLDNKEIAEAFESPVFPLLLGRSGDLASVERVDKVVLDEKVGISIRGTVFPLSKGKAIGQLQAFPTHFSNTIPRKGFNIQPYYILKSKGEWKSNTYDYLNFDSWVWDSQPVFIDVEGYHDRETGLDLWWFGESNTC